MLKPVLWIHGEALGPANPALLAHPAAPALFVFDADLIAGRTAPGGVSMGHAGALTWGSFGTWEAKRTALEEAGVQVCSTIDEAVQSLVRALGR